MVAGAFQSTGWPAVVATVGNWFGPGKSVAPSSFLMDSFFFSPFFGGVWGVGVCVCVGGGGGGGHFFVVVGFCVD